MRAQNKLKKGEKSVNVGAFLQDYIGELNEENEAHGEGVAGTLHGFFIHDKLHGFCRSSILTSIIFFWYRLCRL